MISINCHRMPKHYTLKYKKKKKSRLLCNGQHIIYGQAKIGQYI